MVNASSKYSDQEIIEIYNEKYLKQHIGGITLSRQYGVTFYPDFERLGLKMRNNQEKNRQYHCDRNYFRMIDSEEKAYWLGFIYGDGYITHPTGNSIDSLRFGMSIMNDDINHLEKFKKAIHSDAPIHTYSVSEGYKIGTKYCRIIIGDDEFTRNLVLHGVVEQKSNIMNPPIGVPEELERHFIRGFMDANGSIKITTEPRISFGISFTSTRSVLTWIMNHLIKNNILSHEYDFRKRKENHIVEAFEFGGNYLVKKYLDYIYDGASVWLDRKYDRYIQLCNLLQKREEDRKREKCDYCGTTESPEFVKWNHEGSYKGMILCGKHYQQLLRFGKIIPDKNSCCDICGESEGRLTRVSKKYPQYQGMTLCLKHYNQLMYHGRLLDLDNEIEVGDQNVS